MISLLNFSKPASLRASDNACKAATRLLKFDLSSQCLNIYATPNARLGSIKKSVSKSVATPGLSIASLNSPSISFNVKPPKMNARIPHFGPIL